jgi:hypothetical protein
MKYASRFLRLFFRIYKIGKYLRNTYLLEMMICQSVFTVVFPNLENSEILIEYAFTLILTRYKTTFVFSVRFNIGARVMSKVIDSFSIVHCIHDVLPSSHILHIAILLCFVAKSQFLFFFDRTT